MTESTVENIKTGSITDHINEIDQLVNGKQLFILCDENTFLFLDYLFEKAPSLANAITIKVPSGEKHKTVKSASLIWEILSKNKARRNAVLINFGGGLITDLGGFAAATFKRGINYINIPTSLLGMIDASVGGKTGLNLNHEKNMIGVFNNPDLVICDPFFLKSQSNEQISSGFAEVIKHGLICDCNYWKYCTSDSIKKLDLNKIISGSIKIKAKIVAEDPKEIGKRRILNFGHTIGHAIETLMINKNKPVSHGYAIATGLYIEASISHKIAKLSTPELLEIQNYISANYSKINFNEADLPQVFEIMKNDKKRDTSKYNFTLIKKIGAATFDNAVEENIIKESILEYQNNS